MTSLFDTVLVANRGEIAVRVVRTLRRLGIRSVAVYSDADAAARHVAEADVAVRLGPTPAADSYLKVEAIVDAARRSGASALHPGYGFLSESPRLAEACAAAGITFVGPPPRAIEVMGDKINAKEAVAAAGVPVVPGVSGVGLDDAALAAAAAELGMPVLLKPSAGGGGKGMRRVDDPGRLPAEIAAARREAAGAFGDDTLLVERFVTAPRHIEIQVMADAHGGCVHLGERECSLQRRHQKVIEEAPSVLLDERRRAAMGAAAVAAARAVAYVGAGTVEFIVSADDPDTFFFMEMNTRLQVEHPVTEAVTGLDLVECQLRVAAGQPLGFDQGDVHLRGHAVEARVYAEDPERGFLPASGTVVAWREPAGREGVRVDSGVGPGAVVATAYDPMLAKVVAHGRDRSEALARLDAALAGTVALGVTTNVAFLRRLLRHPAVAAGRMDTGLIDREGDALLCPAVPDEALVVAALALLARRQGRGPWDQVDGWRPGRPAEAVLALSCRDRRAEVGVTGPPTGAAVRVGDGEARAARIEPVDGGVVLTSDGVSSTWAVAPAASSSGAGPTVWVGRDGAAWPVEWRARPEARRDRAAGGAGPVTSPMPGTVLEVHVQVGDRVAAGAPLVTVEAMKMEYVVAAPADGTVTAVHTAAGRPVTLDEVLAEVGAADGAVGEGG